MVVLKVIRVSLMITIYKPAYSVIEEEQVIQEAKKSLNMVETVLLLVILQGQQTMHRIHYLT